MPSAYACESIKDPDGFTDYYQNPDPNSLPDLLYCYSQEIPTDDHSSVNLLALYLATALDSAPQMAKPSFEKAITLPRKQTVIAVTAAWLMKKPEGKEFLRQAVKLSLPHAKRLLAKKPPNFKGIANPSAFHLDCFWSIFLASGKVWPVQKIISTLAFIQNNGEKVFVGYAAKLSLISNAKSHPKVLKIIREEKKHAPPFIKQQLQEIINDALK
jgi:hypothetical protein